MKRTIKKAHKWLMCTLITVPVPCFANSGTSPITILQNIIDYLTGDLARVVGALVVIGAGYLFLSTHQIEKKTFIRIVIGMGLILGGSTLADMWWG